MPMGLCSHFVQRQSPGISGSVLAIYTESWRKMIMLDKRQCLVGSDWPSGERSLELALLGVPESVGGL